MQLFEIIIVWILTALGFWAGYLIGQNKLNPESLDQTKKFLLRKIDTSRVGIVNRPTAQQIKERQDKTLQGAKEAMRESLANIPEVQEELKRRQGEAK